MHKRIKSDELESVMRRLVFPGDTSVHGRTSHPTSPQNPSTEHSSASSSSQQHPPPPTQNTSSTTSPMTVFSPGRRDDPSNPLAPRGLTWDNGYLHRPIIHFFSSQDSFAQDEFERIGEIVSDAVQDLGYKSYSVSLTHAGYSFLDGIVPVIVCIVKDLDAQDAERIQSLFFNLERQYIREIFLYKGSITMSTSKADDFRLPQTNPDCGYSIGPAKSDRNANPECSSSLGIYIRIQGDPNKRTFVTTVHHGLGKTVAPIDVESLPQIPIQHPSKIDMELRETELKQEYEKAEQEPHPRRRDLFMKFASEALEQHRAHDSMFGNVYASEQEVVSHDDHLSWSDWCVVEVLPAKVGKNAVMGYFHTAGKNQWIPRDRDKMYIRGIRDISQGDIIRKAGRATGDTVGKIEFAYSFVQFDDSDIRTREWCVVTSPVAEFFSGKGDSGAPVVSQFGQVTGFILGGSDGLPTTLTGHENLGPVFVSYISPAILIIERIAKKLGATVEVVAEDIGEIPDVVSLEAGYLDLLESAPKVFFSGI